MNSNSRVSIEAATTYAQIDDVFDLDQVFHNAFQFAFIEDEYPSW